MAKQNFRLKTGLEVGIGATILFVDNNGNIGISSTNPKTKLSIEGSSYISENLGIGDTNPQYKLSFGNNSLGILPNDISLSLYNYSNDNFGIGINTDSVSNSKKYFDITSKSETGYLRVFTGLNTQGGFSTERLRITPDGYVSVGTTETFGKVTIDGKLSFIDNIILGGSTTDASNLALPLGSVGLDIPIELGLRNVIIVPGAGASVTSGSDNIFIGFDAGLNNDFGYNNIFIGKKSGSYNTSGYSNLFLGNSVGISTTSSYRIILGQGNIKPPIPVPGFIDRIFLTNPGAGYTEGDVGITSVTFDNSGTGGFGASAQVGIDIPTGTISFIDLIDQGSDYTIPPTLTITPPIGSGVAAAATATISTLLTNNDYYVFDSPYPNKDKQLAIGINTNNVNEYWIFGDDNFNVGIGSTQPQEKLSVAGNAYISGILTAQQISGDKIVVGLTTLSNDYIEAKSLKITGVSTLGTLDVQNDLTVYGNLTVQGDQIIANTVEVRVEDKNIVLGYTTATQPNDITASGGGIAIASTEGTPLVSFAGISTLPDTYKQILWSNGTTDAWLFNYAVGIGTTQIPAGVEFAVGNVNIGGTGIVTANIYYGQGGALTLGTPSDGNLVTPGALNTFTSQTSIVNSIDDLNELSFNIIKNTAVTDVNFSSSPLAGGSPLNVTLGVTYSGNPNRYDVDWGDGTTTLNATSPTIPHTYTQPNGGLFTVIVTAKNNSGIGAGSSYTTTKVNYITVYTPNPVVSFDLYRVLNGGTALSAGTNNFYVVEGQSLYLDNNTTNTSDAAGVNYTVNWGDGSTNNQILSDNVGGGASATAPRLQHTWGSGTNSGTGFKTITLTLNNHLTADPAIIPTSNSASLKVYASAPTAPNGLSSKTLSNVTSVGTSPLLASGFTDNTGGTTLSAGNSVNRVTSGTAEATAISSFAYDGSNGTLTAIVNSSPDGSRVLTSSDDSGTYSSLVITAESDYQLLDASGNTTTFALSTYYPGLYSGFKAKVSKLVSALNVGVNSMRLSHSTTGSTNAVQFVKDNLTAVPTVGIQTASITENVAGTYRYISGIPYYNTGSPSLTLSTVNINDLVGQCYTNQTNIVDVANAASALEGSGNVIVDTSYTYSNINNVSSSMLNGGIPIVNVGTATSYRIANLTIPITPTSVRSVRRVRVRATNVNGTSAYTSDIVKNIQVHTAAQSGISEISISVSPTLGQTYTDNGVRISNFKSNTTDTPAYNNLTNFYTNSPYTESSDPGVSGTKEATVRMGIIKYDVTDYSTYLPAGPNRSGDTGTQYFTFAFRRSAVSSFNINITSSGVSGVWIAAPKTNIDSTSGLNGWLRCDTAYNGSGIPGSNTGNGGNGSDGCASNTGTRIIPNTSLSGSYSMTLGTESLTNSTGNVALVRIALTTGQTITSLSIT